MSDFPTDVPGVFADGTETYGIEEYPVFNVPAETFHQRLELDDQPGINTRRRLSAPEGSNLDQYLKNTELNMPFYIKHSDGENDYIKKIR